MQLCDQDLIIQVYNTTHNHQIIQEHKSMQTSHHRSSMLVSGQLHADDQIIQKYDSMQMLAASYSSSSDVPKASSSMFCRILRVCSMSERQTKTQL